ncbi:hypothetical protein B0H13DRAFT_1899393 [Mycena leptocephala]|nr:hypothetical protein B0H13DRAFT_1899393 [Mycena leptocephala]
MFGFLAVILRLVFFFAAINFAAVLVFVRVLIFIFIFSILSFIGGVDGWDLEEAQLGALGATCRSRDFNPHPLERRVRYSTWIWIDLSLRHYPLPAEDCAHPQRCRKEKNERKDLKPAPTAPSPLSPRPPTHPTPARVPRNALRARSGGESAASDSKAKTGVSGSKEGRGGGVRRVHAGRGIGIEIGELASPPFVPLRCGCTGGFAFSPGGGKDGYARVGGANCARAESNDCAGSAGVSGYTEFAFEVAFELTLEGRGRALASAHGGCHAHSAGITVAFDTNDETGTEVEVEAEGATHSGPEWERGDADTDVEEPAVMWMGAARVGARTWTLWAEEWGGVSRKKDALTQNAWPLPDSNGISALFYVGNQWFADAYRMPRGLPTLCGSRNKRQRSSIDEARARVMHAARYRAFLNPNIGTLRSFAAGIHMNIQGCWTRTRMMRRPPLQNVRIKKDECGKESPRSPRYGPARESNRGFLLKLITHANGPFFALWIWTLEEKKILSGSWKTT